MSETNLFSRELARLAAQMDGHLEVESLTRRLYATDASEYQEMPVAVAFPRTDADVAAQVRFASRHRIGIIPRTAGASLAGQVVGSGIVVDTGRYMSALVALDAEACRVRVQPGVVRDELNRRLFLTACFLVRKPPWKHAFTDTVGIFSPRRPTGV